MALYKLSGYIKCLKPWNLSNILMVLSLSVSLAIFFFLSLYVEYADGLNSAFAKSERIYRLVNERSINEQIYRSRLDAYPIAPALQQKFPDVIETVARLYGRGTGIEVADKGFGANVSLVDRDFFDMFDLVATAGDFQSVIDNPRNVAIEANFARTVFGNKPALGELITLNVDRETQVDYLVSAVFEYPKGNISLNYPLFALLDPTAVPEMRNLIGMWSGGMNVQTFVLARTGANVERAFNDAIETQLSAIFPQGDSGLGAVNLLSQRLQNIREIHQDPVDGEAGINTTVLNSLRALALLVFSSGIVNFVLLTISNYSGRTKEFSVRKATGSGNRELLAQLAFESLLFLAISAGLLWLATESLLPVFGAFVAVRNLEDMIPQGMTTLTAALGFMAVFVVGLSYALLRNISPLARGRFSPGNEKLKIAQRVSLAGLMLVAYSTLVIMFSVNEQMTYLKSRGLGLDPANIYSIQLQNESHNTIDDLVLQLEAVQGISLVTRASTMATTQLGTNSTTSISVDNSILGSVVANKALGGKGFFELYGMSFVAGTSFDGIANATSGSDQLHEKIVINEKLAEALGFDSPANAIGELVYEKIKTTAQGIQTNTLTIVGVIRNTKFFSLVDDYKPEAYVFADTRLGPSLSSVVSYKIQHAEVEAVTAEVRRILRQNFPDREFTIYDADFAYQLHFSNEDRMLKMYKLSSLLTGVIALLTLYSYLEFHVKTRARTLAIRRVLGETLTDSFRYLSTRNATVNGAAIAIGGFYSYTYVASWLEQFTVQLEGLKIVFHAVTSFMVVLFIYSVMNMAFAVYLSNKRVIEDLKEE